MVSAVKWTGPRLTWETGLWPGRIILITLSWEHPVIPWLGSWTSRQGADQQHDLMTLCFLTVD